MSDHTHHKEISGVCDMGVLVPFKHKSLTSDPAEAANIRAPSLSAELEKNNRILADERDAALTDLKFVERWASHHAT